MAIDYDALFGGDQPYDPCALLTQLRPAYMRLVVEGGGTQEISFRDRTVRFHKADSDGFAALIRQLESECAAKQGRQGPRRATSASYRRGY